MRKPAYHSPSSLSCFLKNREEYYLRYLSDNRPARASQTLAMAAGSGFDALVKSFLGERLGLDPVDYWTLQVEEPLRDAILPVATRLFDTYCASGALADLCLLLDRASGTVYMEQEIRKIIPGTSFVLLGKPDIYFKIKTEACGEITVIVDWKVNGIYKNSGELKDDTTSPVAGYSKIYPGGACHKEFVPTDYCGVAVGSVPLANEDWGRQLATYSWLTGSAVGAPVITGIDQLVGPLGRLRVACHRALIPERSQLETMAAYQLLDNTIESGHIFTDLSLEDSLEKQRSLDIGEPDPDHKNADWWRSSIRSGGLF